LLLPANLLIFIAKLGRGDQAGPQPDVLAGDEKVGGISAPCPQERLRLRHGPTQARLKAGGVSVLGHHLFGMPERDGMECRAGNSKRIAFTQLDHARSLAFVPQNLLFFAANLGEALV
jgi:hypothetical protein